MTTITTAMKQANFERNTKNERKNELRWIENCVLTHSQHLRQTVFQCSHHTFIVLCWTRRHCAYMHLPYIHKILFIYIVHSRSQTHSICYFFLIRAHICCFALSSSFGTVALSILHIIFFFSFVAVLGLFSVSVCLCLDVCSPFIFLQ